MDNIQYLSVDQIVESPDYPFSLGQLRFFLTKRHQNGLEKAIRKIGKRLYLRKDLFDAWIEKQACKE